jgi:hypothetical protein
MPWIEANRESGERWAKAGFSCYHATQMAEETQEPWLPNWRPKLRAWLDELLDFGFIFASLVVFDSGFRLGRTALGLDADLMNFMERSDHFAVRVIWVLFLLSQVRRAATLTISPPVAPPVTKKKQSGSGRRSR